MAALVFFDAQGRHGKAVTDPIRVRDALRGLGLEQGRWTPRTVGDGSLEAVLAAYCDELDALRERLSIRSVDRVTMRPGNPDWPALRKRLPDGHAGLLCEAGDWVLVPAGTPHFFDAGDRPDFDALRLFSVPQGWKAKFTGAPSPKLPLLDDFVARLEER